MRRENTLYGGGGCNLHIMLEECFDEDLPFQKDR